jgi:hypothetical protein
MFSMDYAYADKVNLSDITRTGGHNQSFTYDKINRMETSTGSWGTVTYVLNALDNRTSKTISGKASTGYTYSNNKMMSQGSKKYVYDGANIISDGSFTFQYDPFNNIHTSTKGSNVVGKYYYDAQNNRAYKKAGNETTLYHYGQSGNVLSELNQDGKGLVDYIYLNNILVARSNNNVRKSNALPWLMLLLHSNK